MVSLPQARRTCSYGENMDPELMVITPALEREPGMDEAGPLPVAPDPRTPMPTIYILHHHP